MPLRAMPNVAIPVGATLAVARNTVPNTTARTRAGASPAPTNGKTYGIARCTIRRGVSHTPKTRHCLTPVGVVALQGQHIPAQGIALGTMSGDIPRVSYPPSSPQIQSPPPLPLKKIFLFFFLPPPRHKPCIATPKKTFISPQKKLPKNLES
jgi:hypothetical protein